MLDPQLLDIMIGAALEAGAAAAVIFRGDHELTHKKITLRSRAADHAAEAIILRRLGALFAHIPIIAEEVAAGRVPSIGRTFFLVDPLDGTREFIAGRPNSPSTLLSCGTRAVLGVVYAPATAISLAVMCRRAGFLRCGGARAR